MFRGVFLAGVLYLAGAAVGAPAAGAAVVLNEVNCEGTDWVELVNTSETEANVSGWLLTDDPLDSTRPEHRFRFPDPTVIPAFDDLVVEKGAAGFPFGVSCGSDTIRLADAGTALVDEIAVPTLTSGADTWGRYPNGTGSWVQTRTSKEEPNEPSSAAGGPPADLAAWMFDPEKVVAVDLTLSQAASNALNSRPDEYQSATFSLQTTAATYGPLEVGVRLKGGTGSFRPLTAKAAFKVKFDYVVPGQRLSGLKKLTLNNMVQDPSMLHEALSYEAFRSLGVAAPRTGYAYVRVNEEEYGLYLNLETLDQVSLPRWFASTRHLYEGSYGTDTSPGAAGAFEVDQGSDTDRGDLEALIDAVNDDEGDWSEGMEAVADLSQMTRMWAVERYVGHWDGYAGGNGSNDPNNYYLHDETEGRFTMLPWGTDQTLDQHLLFGADAALMFDKCVKDASCAQMYRDAVREARTTISGLGLDSRAARIETVLTPWQERDPRRETSMAQARMAVTAARDFLASRPSEAAGWLDPPQLVIEPAVTVPSLPLRPGPSAMSSPSIAAVEVILASNLRTAARTLRRRGTRALLKRGRVHVAGMAAPEAGVLRIHASARKARGQSGSGFVTVLRGRRAFGSSHRSTLTLALTGVGRRLLEHRRRVTLTLHADFRNRAGRLVKAPRRSLTIGRLR